MTNALLLQLPRIEVDSIWKDENLRVIAVDNKSDNGLVVFTYGELLLRADKITFLEMALGKPLVATIQISSDRPT